MDHPTPDGQGPISVEHIRREGTSEWFARIPGTTVKGAGSTYEEAVGSLVVNHRFELGFKITHLEQEEANHEDDQKVRIGPRTR